jgi:hypothetical protein
MIHLPPPEPLAGTFGLMELRRRRIDAHLFICAVTAFFAAR